MEGVKYDKGKLRWDLLPLPALKEVVKVLTKGAEKYADWNWIRVTPPSRYYRAAIGHLNDFWLGEDNDQEIGICHLANACCCVLFLLSMHLLGIKMDRQDKLEDKFTPKPSTDESYDGPKGVFKLREEKR